MNLFYHPSAELGIRDAWQSSVEGMNETISKGPSKGNVRDFAVGFGGIAMGLSFGVRQTLV